MPDKDPRELFKRRWYCEVTATGYHNGVRCDPKYPHQGWNCEYRWSAPSLTDAQAATYGLMSAPISPE